MSIKHAMLGFLSWRPMSGYDLKKLFAGWDFVVWAGSNNQIYQTLVEMHREGLVTSELEQPDRGPGRKIYKVTASGEAALLDWLRSAPETPQLRNAFLIQLAWADHLTRAELDALLERYEHEVLMQLTIAREQQRRGAEHPERSPRETYLWERIADNRIGFYENELAWVRRTRGGAAGL